MVGPQVRERPLLELGTRPSMPSTQVKGRPRWPGSPLQLARAADVTGTTRALAANTPEPPAPFLPAG
jgi:hypothetical protein